MPASWTTEEVELLATAVYQKRRPMCSRCSNPIRGEFIKLGQRRTTPIDLHCDFCGLRAEYDPIDIEHQDLQWTDEQKRSLVREYRQQGRYIRCLADGAYLVDIPSKSNIGYFTLHCPHCGRHLVSSEVT
jgi:hypothetical protein